MAEVHNIEKSHIQKCLIHISKKLLLIILSTATWTKFESNFKDVIILDKGVKDKDWQFPVGGSGAFLSQEIVGSRKWDFWHSQAKSASYKLNVSFFKNSLE